MPEQEWRVAAFDELPEPGAREFRAGDGDWPFRGIIVRWQGCVYAYANSCAHLGHPLNIDPEGFFTPDRSLLLCSSHGAVFQPDTGLCVGGPCAGVSLRKLPSRVEDGHVYVTAPATMRKI